MGLFRDIQEALRQGLDDLLHGDATRDQIEEVTELIERDISEARSELDLAAEDERRIQRRIDEEQRDAEVLARRAQEAVERGDDELARELIRRRRRVLRGVQLLEQQWTEHKALMAELRDHLEDLQDRLHELRLRGDFLRTRNRVAALRERYERYRGEYGLDALPGLEDDLAEDLEPDAEPDEDLAPLSHGERLEPHEEVTPSAPEPITPRGEAPRPEPAEAPPLRVAGEPGPGPDDEEAWDLPPRNLRLERERMLSEIERRQRGEAFERELEAELEALRRRSKARGEPEERSVEPAPADEDADSGSDPQPEPPTPPEAADGDDPAADA